MSIFFDEPLVKRKDARLRLPPAVVDTGWRAPTSWPNLSDATVIALDTETKDLELTEAGPGWGRGRSHIVGYSLAAEDRRGNRGKWYFPMRHEFGDLPNLDVSQALAYATHTLNTPNVEKIGLNLTYDIGNLMAEGVKVAGKLHECQFAEALIDSDAEVSLEYMARKYLGRGKTSAALFEWIRAAYPNTAEDKLRREIYRSPLMLVGPYAEDDADEPLDIWKKQAPIIEREQLTQVYRLECDLIPLMIKMRMGGVPIDLEYAHRLHDELELEIASDYVRIRETFGFPVYKTSSNHIGPFLDILGLEPIKFVDGNSVTYRITKEWLTGAAHPFADAILHLREMEKITSTFLRKYLFSKHVNGLIFPQFHQIRGEEGGTKLGRFASSDPNLQNIPSRTKLGKRVREAFIKRANHKFWRKFDFSQIHYRLLAHYAVDRGDGSAEALRNRYISDRKTDYHMDVYKNVAPFMGWSLTDEDEIKLKRRPIKNVNFGLLYGQSAKSLAYKAGMTGGQADEFFKAYHSGAPYVRPTMEAIEKEMQRYGYISTLLGRRIRFNEWEPTLRKPGQKFVPLSYSSAFAKWGDMIKRSYGYRAVNYRFQGSEPDIMKSAMLACYNSGVFDYTGYPLVTVHDELDFSVEDDSPEMRRAFDFIQYTMENTIKLRVPLFVDESNGPNWGKAD